MSVRKTTPFFTKNLVPHTIVSYVYTLYHHIVIPENIKVTHLEQNLKIQLKTLTFKTQLETLVLKEEFYQLFRLIEYFCIWAFGPSNAEATFAQSARTQRFNPCHVGINRIAFSDE